MFAKWIFVKLIHVKSYFKTFKYYLFKEKSFFFIFILIKLFFLIILKKKIKYRIQLRNYNFFFNFLPSGTQTGSYGFFLLRQYYEPLLLNLDKLIKAGDTVLDIGSNQGIYTLAMSKIVKSKGTVIAVEPFTSMIKCLKNNIKINKVNNISIYENVIIEKVKKVKLFFNKGTVSASVNKNKKIKRFIFVNGVTLDNICSKLKKVNFIKLDIEGAELKALKGGKRTISKYKPTISVEADKHTFHSINRYLSIFGYKPYVYNKHGELIILKEIKEKIPNIIFIFDEKNNI